MIDALVRGSVLHARWVVAITLVLAIAGIGFARGVTLDALPDVTSNQVLVLATAPGFSPEELELRVTTPLELAFAGTPDLEDVRSVSRYGVAAITVVFDDDVPALSARQQIAERIASVRSSLPAGVEDVSLGPLSGGLGEIVQFAIESDERSQLELAELARYRVAPILRRVRGVVEVNSWGGGERTFDVRIDPARLAEKGFTIASFAAAIDSALGVAPGASVRNGASQLLLRGLSRPTSADEIAVLRVLSPSGRAVRIAEVATVTEGMKPRLGAATIDGRGQCVYVLTQMLRGDNALRVVGRVDEALPALRNALPPDVRIVPIYDRGVLVRATLRTVAKNLLEGALLVIVVLLVTLGSLRAGLVVASVIPLAMIGAAVGMRAFGIPGNLMSLGALDFGLVVDGAVVLVEHLFHAKLHSPRGDDESHEHWLARTASSVARPTLFAMLTISLVYVPVVALTGVDGKMFRPMALVVLLALGSALVLSLTFVPALASLLPASAWPSREPWFARVLARVYPPVARAAQRRSAVVVTFACALLLVGGLLFARLGTELAPTLDEGDLVVQTTRAPDIHLSGAIHDAVALERAVREVPEVLQVATRIGSPAIATDLMGFEQADVFVRLAPKERWRAGLTRDALIDAIESRIHRVDPNVDLSFTQPIQMRFNELLGGSVTDVAVSVYGDDLARIQQVAHEIAGALHDVPHAVDIRVLAPDDVQVLSVEPDSLRSVELGLAAGDVLDAVRAAQVGVNAGSTARGVQTIPVLVKLTGADDFSSVASARIPTSRGGVVPVASVADVRSELTPGVVQHRHGERRLMIGFNVRGGDLATVVDAARKRVEQRVRLPREMHLEWGGQIETLQQARDRLMMVVPLVALLIVGFMFFVFRAFRPLILLVSHVPLACVGGVIGLWSRGLPLSISAIIGFIALSGIAVMNGMVLLVRAQQLEMDAPAVRIIRAASDRVRPVLTTAMVAALGFVPMMLATGVGAEVQRPLATVVVAGLFTSTFATLVVMPAVYPWRHKGR